jgi:hypothetical protein
MLFADLPWDNAKPKDADFRLLCTLGGASFRPHPLHYTSSPMTQLLPWRTSSTMHRPLMANSWCRLLKFVGRSPFVYRWPSNLEIRPNPTIPKNVLTRGLDVQHGYVPSQPSIPLPPQATAELAAYHIFDAHNSYPCKLLVTRFCSWTLVFQATVRKIHKVAKSQRSDV